MQGKNKPIKDWKACVRTWERNTKVCPEDTIPVYDDSKNKQMSEEEVIEIIKRIKQTEPNMGKVIGLTVKEVGNAFDKSKIAALVKSI